MLPRYRKHLYSIWRACERFSILPPQVKSDWDSCDVATQSFLIAYDQIRSYEKQEEEDFFYKFFGGQSA